MNYERECLICGNPTGYSVEVDIGIGTMTSNEPPICEECCMSENEYIKAEVASILSDNQDLFPL